MKKIAFLHSLTIALLIACPLAGRAEGSWEKDPAYLPINKVLDLKTIQPAVNINLPRFLLQDAVSELKGTAADAAGGKDIDLADLVKDVKLIRVVVIEANSTNRPALDKGMKELRKQLEEKWTPIVSVPEENVGVYALGDASGESTAGLAVLIYNDGDAVIGNVVGRVPIGKLIKIASQMDKLPKAVLEKLGNLGKAAGAPSDEDKGVGETKKPAVAPAETKPSTEAPAADPSKKADAK